MKTYSVYWHRRASINIKIPFPLRVQYTVKNIDICTDILWQVFHILTELVPCTFVSINRRNNEALAHIATWVMALLICRFTDTNIYGTGML